MKITASLEWCVMISLSGCLQMTDPPLYQTRPVIMATASGPGSSLSAVILLKTQTSLPPPSPWSLPSLHGSRSSFVHPLYVGVLVASFL